MLAFPKGYQKNLKIYHLHEGTSGGLATPLCEEVKERKFRFRMTHKEKRQYKKGRKKRNMRDKKFYNRKNWGKDY